MSENKALVAKSYENLEQVCEPYTMNGKEYVKVRMKNGSIKQVRAYSEAEYRKYNPEVKIIKPAKSRRDILGFGEKGFIWIFKGETYENLDWFHSSPCRYARTWGWYLPSDIEMPSPLPTNIEPLKLEWDEVSFEDQLISEDQIKEVVDKMLYDAGTSRYIGKVGDRLEMDVTCKKASITQSIYGISYFYVFEDSEGNVYTWGTSARSLDEGVQYHLKGTVKDHTTYRNVCQTVLTRCKVEEIE
jgi:hypothetical protein